MAEPGTKNLKMKRNEKEWKADQRAAQRESEAWRWE
jgi:hypothetical protein